MMQSLAVGLFLAAVYAYCLRRWTFHPAQASRSLARPWLLGGVFVRILSIASVFLTLAYFSTLNIPYVLFAFTVGISCYLFRLAGRGLLDPVKAATKRRS